MTLPGSPVSNSHLKICRTINFLLDKEKDENYKGSGCSSVYRPVVSNARGPRFEFSHRQTIITFICVQSTRLKRRKQIKRGQEWPIFIK